MVGSTMVGSSKVEGRAQWDMQSGIKMACGDVGQAPKLPKKAASGQISVLIFSDVVFVSHY